MLSIIYASSASKNTDLKTVQKILNESCKHNKKNDITGCLLFDGDYFLQYFEGKNKKVEALYRKIKSDKRHNNIKLIDKKEIKTRNFAQWSMAFVNQAHITKKILKNKTDRDSFKPHLYSYKIALNLMRELSCKL